MSVMTAGSAMMGQNFGAGKYDRIKKIVHVSHLFTIVFAAFFVIIFLLFPYQIFGIFDPNPEVQAWAPTYMKIAAINYMAFAFMAPYNALINGLGFATLSFIIGIMDGVVARIGLSLLFGLALNMGIAGFWLGNALAGYMTVLLGGIYYFSGKWKTRKLIIET